VPARGSEPDFKRKEHCMDITAKFRRAALPLARQFAGIGVAASIAGMAAITSIPSSGSAGDFTGDANNSGNGVTSCPAPGNRDSLGNHMTSSGCWYKGVNYDPAGNDTWDWGGSPVDPKVVWRDVSFIAASGARWVRLTVPPPPLLLAPPGQTWQEAADVVNYNFKTVLNAVQAYKLTPEIVIAAWCYTPTKDKAGCLNPVENHREPNNERRVYENWLRGLVLTSGAIVFEIGNEPNLNFMEETNYSGNPDLSPSGWYNMPDCQLDDPSATVGDCNTNKVPKELQPTNPRGFCDGSLMPDGRRAPDGPSKAYLAAVDSYDTFLGDSYETIKKANPRAFVVSGGLSSFHANCFPMDGRFIDAVGYHAYPIFAGPIDAADTVDYLNKKLNLIRTPYHLLPVWVTEFGFTLNKQGGPLRAANEQQKAEFVRQEWADLRCKVTGPDFLYQLQDTLRYNQKNGEPLTSEPGFAMERWFYGEPVKLPSFYAFRDVEKGSCRDLRKDTTGAFSDDPFANRPVRHYHPLTSQLQNQ
jgi:Glycosyl hydrolase catalytic core